MILGYTLIAQGANEGTFFDGTEPSGTLCLNCGSCLDYQYVPNSIDIHPSRKYDVSFTHDLRKLFSKRFVDFCREELNFDGDFHPVQASAVELYYMFPSQVLEFDVERRKTTFEKPCEQCGGYESAIGAHPAFLKTDKPIESGFFRSGIAFGSNKGKFPLFFVGTEWQRQLSAQKFRGLEFREISG